MTNYEHSQANEHQINQTEWDNTGGHIPKQQERSEDTDMMNKDFFPAEYENRREYVETLVGEYDTYDKFADYLSGKIGVEDTQMNWWVDDNVHFGKMRNKGWSVSHGWRTEPVWDEIVEIGFSDPESRYIVFMGDDEVIYDTGEVDEYGDALDGSVFSVQHYVKSSEPVFGGEIGEGIKNSIRKYTDRELAVSDKAIVVAKSELIKRNNALSDDEKKVETESIELFSKGHFDNRLENHTDRMEIANGLKESLARVDIDSLREEQKELRREEIRLAFPRLVEGYRHILQDEKKIWSKKEHILNALHEGGYSDEDINGVFEK